MTTETFEDDECRWSNLMMAAHRGDKRLYEQLLRELADVIERYINSRFGALSFTEDCVQECLLAIHTGRHTYDPRRPFRPWFFTIVRNKTVDLLRRSYAGERSSVPLAGDSLADVAALPEDALSAGDILAQLQPSFRSALTLTKIHGYSLAEAAERSGISESAMKSRVSRAVRAAELLLNEERNAE
jgi:RNA polymerase sigma-70 factor, ECF subfamily